MPRCGDREHRSACDKAEFSETGEGGPTQLRPSDRDSGPRGGSRKLPQLLSGKTDPRQI